MNDIIQEILTEMQSKPDFPAAQNTIAAVAHGLQSNASSKALAALISQDFALSKKVLRLANSPMYYQFGNNISSITDAVSLLGVSAISQIIMSTAILNTFSLEAGSVAAAKELAQTIVASEMAYELKLSESVADEIQALNVSMANLGRLSVAFYLPTKWTRINELMPAYTLEMASVEVLGMSLNDVGLGLAEAWKFTPQLLAIVKNDPDSDMGKITAVCNALSYDIINQQSTPDKTLNTLLNSGIAITTDRVEQLVDITKRKTNLVLQNSTIAAVIEASNATEPIPELLSNLNAASKEQIHQMMPKLFEGLEFLNTEIILVLVNYPGTNTVKVEFSHTKSEHYAKIINELTSIDYPIADLQVLSIALQKNTDVYIRDVSKSAVMSFFKKTFPRLQSVSLFPVIIPNRFNAVVAMAWKNSSNLTAETLLELRNYRDTFIKALIDKSQ